MKIMSHPKNTLILKSFLGEFMCAKSVYYADVFFPCIQGLDKNVPKNLSYFNFWLKTKFGPLSQATAITKKLDTIPSKNEIEQETMGFGYVNSRTDYMPWKISWIKMKLLGFKYGQYC